jgi:hypothetical protein
MSAPANATIELNVSRGTGLYLHLNGRLVDDSYGTIVMAELAATSRPGRHGATNRHGARPQRNLGVRAGQGGRRLDGDDPTSRQ